MKKYTPATNNAEYAALVNKSIDLRDLISIYKGIIREGGFFAESAAEQLVETEAEERLVLIALANTRTRYNSFLETTEVIAAR